MMQWIVLDGSHCKGEHHTVALLAVVGETANTAMVVAENAVDMAAGIVAVENILVDLG